MESLYFSLKIVVPLFIMMLLGYIIKVTKILSEDAAGQVNKMIFRILLPLLVFMNIYHTDFASSFKSNLLFFSLIGVVIQFFISLSIVLLAEKDNSKRGVMIQGMFRSNFVLFGIPIAVAIYSGASAGVAALLIAVIIPLYNFLSVIALEMFNGKTPSFLKTLKGIITNPLIIASVLALLAQFFHIALPEILDSTLTDISGITTPLAFIILGASFRFGDIKTYVRQITITTLFKLVIFPAIFIGVAILLGFRGVELAVILGVFASPVAVGSFSMAQQMGGDSKLASQFVVITSLLSVVTIFGFIFLLKEFAFI